MFKFIAIFNYIKVSHTQKGYHSLIYCPFYSVKSSVHLACAFLSCYNMIFSKNANVTATKSVFCIDK